MGCILSHGDLWKRADDMELDPGQLAFLVAQGILPEQVFDARGMATAVWQERAREEGMLFVLGAPCRAAGHRLRTRANHCIQCDTRKIAYIRRHAAPGFVYIAASRGAMLLKIGSCVDTEQRARNLRNHRYGNGVDWEIIAWAKTLAMGEVEFGIHRDLESFMIEGSYEHDGRIQRTRELLRGDLDAVWQAYNARVQMIAEANRWRHPGFDRFNFGGDAPPR